MRHRKRNRNSGSKYYIINGARHRKYRYDREKRKSIFLDQFGDPYFAQNRDDRVETISVTIPSSLLVRVDEVRGDVSMSRFVRKSLEYIVERFDKDTDNGEN